MTRCRCDDDQENPVRHRSHEGKPQRLRSSPQYCPCEQSKALYPSRGASEESVFMAPEATSRTSDQPAGACGARGRSGSDCRATRRSSSHDRAACQCEEGRSRRPWLKPAARVAAFPRGFRRRTCAPPRGVGRADRPVGRSIGGTQSEDVEPVVHTTATSSASTAGRASSVRLRELQEVRGGIARARARQMSMFFVQGASK